MRKNLSLLILCFFGILAQAQDSNSELLKKLVEKNVLTPAEADEIAKESGSSTKKSQNQFEESAIKVREAFNTPYMKFGGYGLLTYKYNEYANSHNDFRPRVVFLTMSGKLTNTIGYSLLADFVDPTLYEFYAEWTPLKEFNLKGGQFKVPFTLENSISLANLETIYNTRSISSLSGMGDDVLKLGNKTNGVGRDIGVQISGSLINNNGFGLIEYALGVFQGSGINITDPNNSKDFSGMLLLQPIKGLKIGGGAYFGEATYTFPGQEVTANHVRNRWVVSSKYKSERFQARAEWLHGNDAGTKREGLYGLASYYFIPKKLNLVGKVDYYNKNTDINSEVIDYTCGINYYFYQQCRFQLNYTYSDYSSKWGARNTNMVAAQMQIVF